MPTSSPTEIIQQSLQDIATTLKTNNFHPTLAPQADSEATTLQQLNDIFLPHPDAPLARVEPTTKTVPIDPPANKANHIETQPFLHWLSNNTQLELPPQANKTVNPNTGQLAEYRELRESSDGAAWERSCAMEFGRLAQGFPPDQPTGMDTLEFITYDSIPKDRRKDITYLRLVTADRPHKIESKRVRATAGGDRINYPFDVSTRTAELQTSKILINSTISTPGARFMTLDISNFFLTTKEMKRPKFIRIKLDVIPDSFIKQYNLEAIAHNGHVYAQFYGGMHGPSNNWILG
jgi:hypothetical protein